jgi:hypothetical protein
VSAFMLDERRGIWDGADRIGIREPTRTACGVGRSVVIGSTSCWSTLEKAGRIGWAQRCPGIPSVRPYRAQNVALRLVPQRARLKGSVTHRVKPSCLPANPTSGSVQLGAVLSRDSFAEFSSPHESKNGVLAMEPAQKLGV